MTDKNRSLQNKYWWLIALILFHEITYVSSLFRYRVDLTAEKRFSLTAATKKLLHNLDSTVDIKVFLTGDLPADYKKLSIATEDLLSEFRDLSNNRVQVRYENPGEGLDDSSKVYLYDILSSLGVVFDQTQDVSASNDKATKQLIIPSALV